VGTKEQERKTLIVEELLGVFRRRKTENGDGGIITVSRRKLVGIVEMPPVSIAVLTTDTYDFDAEVPAAMKELGLVLVAGSARTVRRSGSTYTEFLAIKPS
jgi:hypothetical protein